MPFRFGHSLRYCVALFFFFHHTWAGARQAVGKRRARRLMAGVFNDGGGVCGCVLQSTVGDEQDWLPTSSFCQISNNTKETLIWFLTLTPVQQQPCATSYSEGSEAEPFVFSIPQICLAVKTDALLYLTYILKKMKNNSGLQRATQTHFGGCCLCCSGAVRLGSLWHHKELKMKEESNQLTLCNYNFFNYVKF